MNELITWRTVISVKNKIEIFFCHKLVIVSGCRGL